MVFRPAKRKPAQPVWRNAAKTLIPAAFLLCTPAQAITPGESVELPAKINNSVFAQATPRATDSRQIKSLFLRSKHCHQELTDSFERLRLRIGAPGDEVDVILDFELTPLSGWQTGIAFIDRFTRGFMTEASYRARLIGQNHQTLLTLHGQEKSLTGREMCQDIGDKLADRLTQRE